MAKAKLAFHEQALIAFRKEPSLHNAADLLVRAADAAAAGKLTGAACGEIMVKISVYLIDVRGRLYRLPLVVEGQEF
jgi:hypothetical protein